jgi:cellulose biosynthesis protein BcsQ
MAKINLVIADSNEAYLNGLANYFSCNHSNKFQVNCFSKQSYLKDYLLKNNRIDILLVSEDLFAKNLPVDCVNTCIILSSGRVTVDLDGQISVSKYQSGDKLYSSILNIYSESIKDKGILIQRGETNTKIICFYSPSGGSGKTLMSLCSCIQCAKMGLGVFYLNLEMLQSTPAFLSCSSENSLSQILYYVKKRSPSLGIKIEASRNEDKRLNIHYFSPPESMKDLEEINGEDAEFLLNGLTGMGIYDAVIVDISSTLDARNRAVLEKSSSIVLLAEEEETSAAKLEGLIKEFEIISSREGFELLDKTMFVINKYKDGEPQLIEEILKKHNMDINIRIPKVKAEAGLNLAMISGENTLTERVCEMIRKVVNL